MFYKEIMENRLLERALWIAKERNMHVFPCREKHSKPFLNNKGKLVVASVKAPYVKGGFTVATRDETKIIEWWTKYPNAAIGVDCTKSKLVVIDIDVRNGKKGFDSFMSMGIPEDGAFHVITPSGGLHVIFSGEMNSHADVSNGVDIRAKGAYFIAPPSWIIDDDGKKKCYTALEEWDDTPAHFPPSLPDAINKLRKKNNIKKKTTSRQFSEPLDKTLKKAKLALDSLPQWCCDDYFMWVDIGLSLKTLGNDGLELWDEWSRKSSKYDRDALLYRWENFNPRDITIASLFFYAKEYSNAN